MTPISQTRSPRRWRRYVAAASGVALVGGAAAVAGGPLGIGASSHREAPLIAGDPRADNTDVYAFVSPDAPDTVTLISNWIPFEEPNGGPNFYTWADDTRYNIKIDNDGDALADLTYTWVFDTVTRDPNEQFLSNTGQVTSLDDPDLNVYQTYDLTVEPKVRRRSRCSATATARHRLVIRSPRRPSPERHRCPTTRRCAIRRSTPSAEVARRTPVRLTTRSSSTCACSTSSTAATPPKWGRTRWPATTSTALRSRCRSLHLPSTATRRTTL